MRATLFDLALALACFVAAVLLTRIVRNFALASGLIDVPGSRSSHSTPTPRGGGVAIAACTLAGVVVAWSTGRIGADTAIAVVAGGTIAATIGYLDDRHSLPAGLRLAVHLLAATAVVAWFAGSPQLQVAGQVIEPGWWGAAAAVVGIVWSLNLFNFMDGIDGIAASQAIFVFGSSALLAVLTGSWSEVSTVSLLLAAACCGFLVWNWPPARIFMGDAGSSFLGCLIAVLALADTRASGAAPFVWLILNACFIADATVTVLRRLTRRERVHEAHRSHAYQQLARRWSGHRPVTILCLCINVGWLFPLAVFATVRPNDAALLAIVALGSLGVLVLLTGAGRSEKA